MTEEKKEGFVEKLKEKLHGGSDSKGSESKGSGEAGDAKKGHAGFGDKVHEDLHKIHEYTLKEEKKEANDAFGGEGHNESVRGVAIV